MPLISIKTLDADTDTRLALWQITEPVETLLQITCLDESERNSLINNHKSTARRQEILAVRVMLNELFDRSVRLSHNASGCPALSNGYKVSISHTKGWGAVIVSRTLDVAVDIEYVSTRIEKIKSHFLRSDENACTLSSLLLHWCTKETLYKLFSQSHLALTEMRINAIHGDGNSGIVSAENLRDNEEVEVSYQVTDEFALTFIYR